METPRPGPPSELVDTSRHRALSATSRVQILHLVRQAGDGSTAAEVAAATGLHPSTVRAHLEQLVDSGLLDRRRQLDGTPGRPSWRYRAVPRPQDAADRPYRDLAAALIGHLSRAEDDPHAAGVRAGRDWGRALAAPLGRPARAGQPEPSDRAAATHRPAPIDGLVQVLDGLGFAPRVVERSGSESATVHLHSCPFLELAEANPDVVCGVHLGVIGGAMGVLGAAAGDAELEPFAVPGACVVRVNRARGGNGRARR